MKIQHDPSQVTPGRIALIVVLSGVLVTQLLPASSPDPALDPLAGDAAPGASISSTRPAASGASIAPTPTAKTSIPSSAQATTELAGNFQQHRALWELPHGLHDMQAYNPFQAIVTSQPEPVQSTARAESLTHDETAADEQRRAEQRRLDAERALREMEARRLAAEQEIQRRIASLNLNAVDTIVRTDRGMTALIGNRVFHEGQVLPGGLRIVSISRGGITVRVESKQSEVAAETAKAAADATGE